MTEPRHESYINYGSDVILMMRILSTVFRVGSMRQMTEAFNTDCSIAHVRELLSLEGCDTSFGDIADNSSGDNLSRIARIV